MTYPAQAIDLIKESFKTVKVVKSHEIARKSGNLRAENTALDQRKNILFGLQSTIKINYWPFSEIC